MASDTEATSVFRKPSISGSPEGCAMTQPANANTGTMARYSFVFMSSIITAERSYQRVLLNSVQCFGRTLKKAYLPRMNADERVAIISISAVRVRSRRRSAVRRVSQGSRNRIQLHLLRSTRFHRYWFAFAFQGLQEFRIHPRSVFDIFPGE